MSLCQRVPNHQIHPLNLFCSDEHDNPNKDKSILVVAGGGGTGSIGVQIAKRILKFGTVIATASREGRLHSYFAIPHHPFFFFLQRQSNTARRWVQITLWIIVKTFLNKFKHWASRYHRLRSLLPNPFRRVGSKLCLQHSGCIQQL